MRAREHGDDVSNLSATRATLQAVLRCVSDKAVHLSRLWQGEMAPLGSVYAMQPAPATRAESDPDVTLCAGSNQLPTNDQGGTRGRCAVCGRE